METAAQRDAEERGNGHESARGAQPVPRRWIWDAHLLVYRDSSSQQLATPQPDGHWTYSDPSRASTSRISLDYADLDESASAPPPASIPLLRLLRSSSPPSASPALFALDPTQVLAIGRDKSFTPRIRIKDILVSKTHATLFWLSDDPNHLRSNSSSTGYWAIADCGSMHGTFVGEGRLSDSRVASLPHRLHHGDIVTIGSPRHAFAVHLHPSLPCADCSLDSSNLLPLSSTTIKSQPPSPASPIATKSQKGLMLREAIKGLKARYLLDPAAPTPLETTSASNVVYQNRAKERRLMNPPSRPRIRAGSPSTPIAIQPTPFQADSRGAQLLSKLTAQTTAPSDTPSLATSLSTQVPVASRRLGQLIVARSMSTTRGESRPGLGSAPLVALEQAALSSKRDWREDVREQSRKRFKDLS